MFSYLRIFSVISMLAIIGVAAVGGLFLRDRVLEELVRLVEKSNANLGHGYIDGVWKRYRDPINQLVANPASMKDNPQVALFAQDTVHYFQHRPVVRVNIYSSSGQLLISNNVDVTRKLLAMPASPDARFATSQLKQPLVASQILPDVVMQNQDHLKLVQTLIPFRNGSEDNKLPPEGALEVLTDVSEQWDELNSFHNIGIGVVIGIVAVFASILAFTSKRAENIIAKQYEANSKLIEAAAAAEAENRDKSQFLANISHELRTPLNAIIGFSDIIKKEVMPQIQDKKYHEYINDIHSSGVHLLSLINDILDYSKAEAGKLPLEVSEVNASKMVQNSMRLVSPRAESANVRLLEQLPKDAIIMMTDGKKFKQVLLNLLSNAVKFTPAGGQVLVTAWQNISDDTFSFEVEDTGIGIAPKDISRAMSPFGQVDNTLKRKYEGTGLGLPLTKKFVELMGGKFKIESELNRGTKITFTLPREIKDRDGIVVKQAS